ncbi:hypothetical protein [Hymenobacter latericus]|uniref:hypothetical protein n=1 Tax=Hymenobacter sp. YIM 151858-1 TaxID=2987688 RepID=UPI002227F5D1|nr:hypothetical protein [Hymenobacter sp. YIM 151858-1]UYZ61141.1 hypothetical protein OIS50_19420 [Hymenobacter sp. YIM 151858-1]
MLERGAAQAGKTLGQYLSEDVVDLITQRLPPAPAAADANLHSEILYLRQLVENLTVMLGGQPVLPTIPARLPENPEGH